MLQKSRLLIFEPPASQADEQNWRSLHFFNIYRVILAGIFVTSMFIDKNLPLLGSRDPISFVFTSYLYMGMGIFASFAIPWRWAKFDNFVVALAMVDITCLTIIMHNSGGIETGLGMLIVVAIAANSMLTNGQYASLIAAMAAIAILAEQVVAGFDYRVQSNYSQAGFLGAALFATAMLSYVLSRRLTETEELAKQRSVDLVNMSQLNEYVIKRMYSGVIVIDNENRIRLINQSAWHLIGLPVMENIENKNLSTLSDDLTEQLETWKSQSHFEPTPFKSVSSSTEILPNFTRLSNHEDAPILIFLEDISRMNQQAQQMKLASLGRLTASIAHEIRNPLGAISHADQLLAESGHLHDSDKRLVEIIHTHTERVNDIIENVLQLSRRGTALPQIIELTGWLRKFIDDFVLSQNVPVDEIALCCDDDKFFVSFDPTQLQQIIWNLSSNGLRYAKDHIDNPKLEFKCGIYGQKSTPYLDVIDHGPGISTAVANQIFEPFFTTDSKGSGLGLYIARELCELNQARLRYIAEFTAVCCFRIEFSKPRE